MEYKQASTVTLGAAVASAGFATTSATAEIVFTQLTPESGLLATDGDVVLVDFDGDGVPEIEVIYAEPVTGNLNIKIQGLPDNGLNNNEDEILVDSTGAAGIANNPLALQAGEVIGPDEVATRAWQFIGRTGENSTSDSGVSGSNGGGNFRFGDGEQFIGIRTIINGETVYGWIGVVITDEFDDGAVPENDRLTGQITGFAYESTPDTLIVAGDTGASVSCPADVDADGDADLDDILGFFATFGGPDNTDADRDGDGDEDLDDILSFFADFADPACSG